MDNLFRPDSRILVIDDEAANVSFLEALLNIAGYKQVLSTTDSRQSVDLFTAFNPDIVLLDITMPFVDGFGVMNALRDSFPDHHVPILVLTADTTKSTKHQALSGGATDFLYKPLDADEVLLRIRNLLRAQYDRNHLDEQVREQTAALTLANDKVVELQWAALLAEQAKRTFIGNMSHELRTPMNGILGVTSLLTQRSNDDETQRMLNVVFNSCEKLQVILDEILYIASVDAGRVELETLPIDINLLVEEVVGLYEAESFRKGITLTITHPKEPTPILSGDAIRIRQTLGSLIANAVKFTREGGVNLGWNWMLHGDYVQLRFDISDTGIGIQESDQKRIFEHFSQVDESSTRAFGGVGLGLAIARNNVFLMGGSLSFQSAIDKGSTFSVEIQLAPTSLQPRTELPSASTFTLTRSGAPKVLIVDDNEVNLMVASELFKTCGCDIDSAENGIQAIEMSGRANYDLIMMDIQMPICDGIEATRVIRNREVLQGNTRTPIIALTANTLESDVKTYFEVGMDDVLPKPITYTTVKEHLTKHGLLNE